jgi:uncharacterized protein involved in outer membrane biogenesis
MNSSNNGLFARRAKRWAILAAILLLPVIALMLAGPRFQLHDVEARIERPLSRLLGFEVSVRGPVFVHASLRPWVTLQELHARDPRADSGDEALVARDVRMRLNAWALLRDEWSMARLEMSDARLCVTWQPGSACDWRRALGAIDEVTNIDVLTIRRLDVRCSGGPCGRGLERRIRRVDAELPARNGMQLSVYPQDENEPPLARLSAASWSVFRADRPLQLQGALRSGASRVDFRGQVAQPRELRGVQLEFEGRVALGRWHRVELGEVHVQGSLAETDDGYRLRVTDARWGPGTVSADVDAMRGKSGVTIVGKVAARHVDLDPWLDAPTQNEADGGYADVDARFKTSGEDLDGLRAHLHGTAHVAAGPAELPIDQVERWSKGFLKFVLALPEDGATTHVNCLGGDFDLRGEQALTRNARVDTTITEMRAVGSLSLRSGEMNFFVKPHLKKGPLKDAPLIAVSGKIEQPVSRLASADEAKRAQPQLAHLPVEPADSKRPCS